MRVEGVGAKGDLQDRIQKIQEQIAAKAAAQTVPKEGAPDGKGAGAEVTSSALAASGKLVTKTMRQAAQLEPRQAADKNNARDKEAE